jgi:Trk K+ transport system NAD-binding subunit
MPSVHPRALTALSARWRWIWRAATLVLVFVLGVVALEAGVEMSERPGVPSAPLLAKLYYTLGLFVFGGLDLGTPEGGPAWARALLWIAYFGAPVITTSALVEGVLFVVRPESWRLRWTRGHVILGGCGRLTLLYLEQLRQHRPQQMVLVVEKQVDNPHVQAVAEQRHAKVIKGNIASEAVLRSLQLKRARRVVLLTGDDYANLDAASRICRIRPDLASQTLVHVSDLRLLREIEDRKILPEVVLFNSYRSAAQHLVEATLLPHFELTEAADAVVLAGFGRFGQTVLDQLQKKADGKFERVVMIDTKANVRAEVFAEQIRFEGDYDRQVVEDDLRNPAVWRHVRELLGELPTKPVFILGCGFDAVNIRTALWLSESYKDAKIVARCFDRSSFTEQISRECGFEIVSTSELLLAGLGKDWMPSQTA